MVSENGGKDFVKFYFDFQEVFDSVNLMENVNEYAKKLEISSGAYDFERHDDYLVLSFRGGFNEQSYRSFSALCEYLFSENSIPKPVSFEGPEDTREAIESIKSSRQTLDSKL